MGALAIKESHLHIVPPVRLDGEETGSLIGKTEWEDTPHRTRKDLFRARQHDLGKCVSSIYTDNPKTGKTRRVGWVFRKRKPYSDRPKESYLHETWVEIKWRRNHA